MSAGFSRAATRQNTQPSVTGPPASCIIRAASTFCQKMIEGETHGHLPQVQAPYQEERQPCEARLGLDPQDMPGRARAGQEEHVAARSRVLWPDVVIRVNPTEDHRPRDVRART